MYQHLVVTNFEYSPKFLITKHELTQLGLGPGFGYPEHVAAHLPTGIKHRCSVVELIQAYSQPPHHLMPLQQAIGRAQ
jgi:hypothetical protein